MPDVERSAAFYAGRLDFQEIARMPPGDDAGYIGLQLEDSRLAIVQGSVDSSYAKPGQAAAASDGGAFRGR